MRREWVTEMREKRNIFKSAVCWEKSETENQYKNKEINKRAKFSYKIGCSLMLQLYLILGLV